MLHTVNILFPHKCIYICVLLQLSKNIILDDSSLIMVVEIHCTEDSWLFWRLCQMGKENIVTIKHLDFLFKFHYGALIH